MRCIRTIDAYNITIYKENNIREKDKGVIVDGWNIIYKLGKYIQNPGIDKTMQYRTNTQTKNLIRGKKINNKKDLTGGFEFIRKKTDQDGIEEGGLVDLDEPGVPGLEVVEGGGKKTFPKILRATEGEQG
ncbi:hypothetical protein FH972_002222 [Carpinus fangiana]|uniref:Uncharacterized protein n=1 Tax=Carpinus fangiana TaxID=176857 RepID=A0A5N6QGV0_9ROSI|nr:hypothetical protein FH972_002222 [Carpinus fangiana]